jgi:hypothetical protein
VAEDVADEEVVVAIAEAVSVVDSAAEIVGAVEASVEAEVVDTAIVTVEVIGVGEEVVPVGVDTEVHAEEEVAVTEEMAAASVRIVHEAAARIIAIHRPLGIPFKNNRRSTSLSLENRQRNLIAKKSFELKERNFRLFMICHFSSFNYLPTTTTQKLPPLQK